jgi:hypothetical protein
MTLTFTDLTEFKALAGLVNDLAGRPEFQLLLNDD